MTHSTAITSEHMQIAQRIIAFVQEQGWELRALHIEQFKEMQAFNDPDNGAAWKESAKQWAWNMSVGPRTDTELKERKLIGQ